MPQKGLKYSARKMLDHTPEELNEILQGEFTLVFDDGELLVDAHSTVFSRFAWEFHRQYPQTPLLKAHHAKSVIGNGVFSTKTPIQLLGTVSWCVYDTYKNTPTPVSPELLARRIYDFTNSMYNSLVYMTEAYVTSLDIMDFINIAENEKVKEVLDKPEPNQEYIRNSYKVLKEALKTYPELKDNNLSVALRAGLVREGQLLQCLGPRGYVTDMDSHVFKYPITRSFLQGMREFYNLLIESRSSSRSLASNKSLLSDAEYFARRLQILVQVVERMHHGDCGSQKYLRWKIRDAEFDTDGSMLRPSDLEILEGKYYLDETDQTLKILQKSDKQYLGKILKIRSPIAGCAHTDKNGVCSTCLGEISLNIPKGTNIGHLAASDMTRQSNQNILSTKHHIDGASIVSALKIPSEYDHLLKVSPSGNGYMFHPDLKHKEVWMVVLPQYATGLVDLATVDNVEELGLTHISDMASIGLRVVDKDGNEETHTLHLMADRRRASFTYSMLNHIKKVGWGFDDKENYLISLKGWDYNKACMKLPLRQYNMADHAKAISKAIESSKEKLLERTDKQTPEDVLVELSDLVNSKLKVNISLLEIILLGSLIQSHKDHNFFIPKAGTTKELSVAATTIAGRSLSGVLGYNDMAANVTSLNALFKEGRPSLMMDVFIRPDETLRDNTRYNDYYD